ncbi:hypothetical protein KTN05_14735 [Paracoccus sp. Z118]|uniref:hypothetical protein n=1 Tax=Paracoccus sp. Z118 TaxID=2851017 RepID=UPI001C2BEABB|nr:hypothetical protein [Paracoccus sp. Z118]MBV0893081.1 hypothetical protein [Paracoccus sp. Z118]
MIEFGRALFIRNELAFAADIATRRVLIDPPETSGDLEHLEATIREAVTFNRDRLEVVLELPPSGGIIQITLRQPLTLLVPGLYGNGITLSLDRHIPLAWQN